MKVKKSKWQARMQSKSRELSVSLVSTVLDFSRLCVFVYHVARAFVCVSICVCVCVCVFINVRIAGHNVILHKLKYSTTQMRCSFFHR